jgi:hypothetical protein
MLFQGRNDMATPEIEKKLYNDLANAYGLSMTSMNKALKAAYKAAADAIVIPPPVTTTPPTTTPPVVTPPVVGVWPKDLTANPTGPKKVLPGLVSNVTTTNDGQIIDGVNADTITVNHKNVTIRNFKTKSILATRTGFDASGLVLEDGIVDGQNQAENAVAYNGYVCRRTEITRTTDAFKAHGNVEIDSCWIHDLNFQTGAGTGAGGFSHNDGVQVSSGNNVSVKNTRIENTRGNAGLFVDPDQGTISNVILQNNFLNNVGNYMIYVKESASNPSTGLPTNVTVIGNTFGKRPDYLDPTWGLMICEIRANNLVFQNNKTVDGKAVSLDGYGKGVVQ